jgi:hypothetical protein
MLLFGGGNMEVFYIDKIDQGIKEYVIDKERKKDLQSDLKVYTKAVKEFNKKRKSQLKDLKKKNLDRNTPDKWYLDFFNTTMEERKKLQATFINGRIELQQKIRDDEWAKMMKMASDEATKMAEKAQKKERKKKDNNLFESQEKAVNEHISDQNKRSKALEALKEYEKDYNDIAMAYDNLNVNESDFLVDKNAAKEDMQKFGDTLNKQRSKMYEGYIDFLIALKENTNDEEWESIIREFNKVID